MAAAAQGKNSGDWLIAFLEGRGLRGMLGLKHLGWGRLRSEEPVFPANPYTECPRLDVYLDEEQVAPLPSNQNTTDCAVTMFYKRRHGTERDHQVAMAADVDTILSLFLSNWRPTEFDGHEGVKVYACVLNSPARFHPDMRHEFDDPALRVSVAEIPLIIRSRSA